MAQVKKLQKGGKYFLFNGLKIEQGDKNYEQLKAQALNGNRAAQRMLATVESDSYDNSMEVNTTGNSVDFKNVDMEYRNDRTGDQFSKGDSWWRRNISRTKEGKDYISDFTKLKFNLDDANSTEPSEKASKKSIAYQTRLFNYNDGKYDTYNMDNAAHEKTVRDIANYFSYGNAEEAAKHYDVSGIDDINALWTIYNNAVSSGQKIDFENFINNVRAERRTKDWDDPTYRILKNFGFTGYDPQAAEEVASKNDAALAAAGFDPEKYRNLVTFDPDGNLVLTDAFANSFGDYNNANGNYWFNDEWYNNMKPNGQANTYDALRGYMSIGKKLYKQDSQQALDFVNNSGYYDKNKANQFVDANDIMQSLWGSSIGYDKYDPNNYHNAWMADKAGIQYRGLSGYDVGKDAFGRDNQLIEYYDDSDARNVYGLINTPRYAILDGNGDFVKDVDISTLTSNGTPSAAEVSLNPLLDASSGEIFAGKYQQLFQGNNGLSDLRVFIDPNTGETVIQDADLKKDQRGKAIKLPTEVAKTIKDSKWFEYISKNKQAKDRFYQALSQLTSSAVGDVLTADNISGWWVGRKSSLIKDFQRAGYSKDEAEQFADAMEKWTRNARSAFRSKGISPDQASRTSAVIYDPIQTNAYKNDGTIQKHQYGKLIGESKGTKGTTKVNKVSGDTDSIKKSFGFGSKDSKQWSSVDTATALALLSDIGSAGLAFAPGANVASALAGAAGSTSTFFADAKRDGLDWGDIGSYGLNLLMDAGTLIPFAGGAIKTAKVVKAIKKAAPTLIKAASMYGLGDAFVNTVDKISKGESFTLDDVRRIVNGVSGGLTLSRTGLLPAKGKKTTGDSLTIKSKQQGVDDLTLDKDDLKAIANETSSEKQAKKLVDIISTKTGKAPNEIANTFNLDDVITESNSLQWKFWKGKKKTNAVNLPKSKTKLVPLTNEEMIAQSKNRNALQNWFYGTGKSQRKFQQAFDPNRPDMLTHTIGRDPDPITRRTIHADPEGNFVSWGDEHTFIPIWNSTKATSTHYNPLSGYQIWMPNITSPTQLQEERYYPGTAPVYNFKQGGILKGQYGLFVPDALTSFRMSELDKKLGFSPKTVTPISYKPTTKSENETLIKSAISGKPVAGNEHLFKMGVTWNAPETKVDSATESADVTTGGGSLGTEIDVNPLDVIEAGKVIKSIGDARKQREIGRKTTMIANRNQLPYLLDRNRRFILPQQNQFNNQIAQSRSQIRNQGNMYADAKLATAGFLTGENNILNAQTDINKSMSDAITQQYNYWDSSRSQNDAQNHQILARNKQVETTAAMANNSVDMAYSNAMSQILDKAALYAQNRINNNMKNEYNQGRQSFYLESLLENTTDPVMRAKIQGQIDHINSPEYQRLNKMGVSFAKKGTKLRPISEQMLIDNQKLVAKAIEKLNDNTIKLILKALS